MKTKIIQFSQIADGSCMNPKRFLGGCHTCDYSKNCKLPEAKKGNKKKIDLKINEYRRIIASLINERKQYE